MKHLKKFNTTTEYDQFKSGSEFVLPNVSFVVESAGVKFNPNMPVQQNLQLIFNITDISSTTTVCYKTEAFSEMIVDGIIMEPVQKYQFTSTGEHVVEYVLIDKKHIPDNCFFQGPYYGALNVSYVDTLLIPEGVETIGYTLLGQGQRYVKHIEFPSTFKGIPTILGDSHQVLEAITFKCPPENILLDMVQINSGTDTGEVIVNYPDKYDYSSIIEQFNTLSNSVVFVGNPIK